MENSFEGIAFCLGQIKQHQTLANKKKMINKKNKKHAEHEARVFSDG